MSDTARQRQMLSLGIPDERDLLEALGRLAVAHGNLEMVQIMCLKTLDQLTPEQAMGKFRSKGAGYIRQKIESRIKKCTNGGSNERKKAVLDLLLEAWCLSERRNKLIHRFWGRRPNGQWATSGDECSWENLPSIDVVEDLVQSIQTVTVRLNQERFNGGLIFVLSNPQT